VLGQGEHLLKPTVGIDEPQVAIIDRKRLADQIEPGPGEFLRFADGRVWCHRHCLSPNR